MKVPQSPKYFLQNSMINMKYVAMVTFAPLHYQLPLKQGMNVILKAYKKTGYVDLCYLLSLQYYTEKKLLGI